MFKLTDLPNYFFKFYRKQMFNKKKLVNFSEYNESLFSTFLESDGAFINLKDSKLLPNLGKNFCPFSIHKTFIVKKESNEEEYKIESNDLPSEIEPKTIIICKSKLSIPKPIENFSFNIKYEKEKLDNTLLFTLNKLMKKIDFYKQYVENEIIENENDKIDDYKFHLFLIYNNIPISDLENVIDENLKILKNKKYIKNKFKLQIIYLIPNIGIYNINLLQKEFNLTKKNLENTKKKMLEENKKAKEENKKMLEENKKIMEENKKRLEENKKTKENLNDMMQKYNDMMEKYNDIMKKYNEIIEINKGDKKLIKEENKMNGIF